MEKLTLKVEGMSCQHCVNSVEKAVGELGAKAQVHLAEGRVEVEYEAGAVKPEQIKEAIEEQGYDVV
ncbi:copper ion binding protein [Paenibacillus chitinolyticus]|uniref:Copper chaperone CopZ n=1 Tax=Paenibacillus chitinolyticus TaxID=79263 RepID=A0A410WT57_9BACL|nr:MULTISPECIES: copper ion binding protein [Paenibacillus]MCY9588728.1 copper ion binding protein [Paenibacillus chitinolyticus]MCY9595768.1 copper ion binding protein [Paenibacillus chitinolyticus]MEC0249022.1 copper ion binding protein [Paenibacillus chitinolyticus]QAV17520.1 copper chaperone [Paenibacillus chitinolyticus]SEF92294.1 copper chaperone [Paenibacillus sp. UNC499MF]